MAEIIKQFESSVADVDDRSFVPTACARQSEDGRWEGWLEFDANDGSAVLRTPRETTQPSRDAVAYWATGLSTVYLQGALARAQRPERPTEREIDRSPTYDGPADSLSLRPDPSPLPRPESRPVLDPFDVYAQGEDLLRQELIALDPSHLKRLLRAYSLMADESVDLDTLRRPALAELIVTEVRKRVGAAPPI
jgi:hypothetical protein